MFKDKCIQQRFIATIISLPYQFKKCIFFLYLISATNPRQVIERYKKVLSHFQRGKSLSESYNSMETDRNTVASSAAIAELAISAPDKFEDVMKGYTSRQKLKVFALECARVLSEDPQLMAEVDKLKDEGKLLPLQKRK